jgi:hypothetical protein
MPDILPEKRTVGVILEALFLALLIASVIVVVISVLGALIFLVVTRSTYLIPINILRLSIAIGIISGLIISYRNVANKTGGISRVRQVYTIVSLLFLFMIAFSSYQIYQDTLLIKDICTQYDQAMKQRDYETAYELMSSTYRQTYTIGRFIGDGGGFWGTCKPSNNDYMVQIAIGAGADHIGPLPPYVSLVCEIILEQINHNWYFTGDVYTHYSHYENDLYTSIR